MTEATVAKLCDHLAAQCGYKVVRLSQTRATRIATGLPDRRYVNTKIGVALWFEVKGLNGKISRDQYDFLADELACHSVGTCGGVDELRELLSAVPAGRSHMLALAAAQLSCWRFRGFRGEAKRHRRPLQSATVMQQKSRNCQIVSGNRFDGGLSEIPNNVAA